jgi:anti-sigma regulatory factor (Ser/Thr protein kinase)
MSEPIRITYEVDGEDFMSAGTASTDMKRVLRQLGLDSEIIRRAAIAMYEGEINMVIHAHGGVAEVAIYEDRIEMNLIDHGPGIPDVELAMSAGYSTAAENIRELGFGAGMGLPNMKKYTDEMTIETEVGKGTTVRMVVRTV